MMGGNGFDLRIWKGLDTSATRSGCMALPRRDAASSDTGGIGADCARVCAASRRVPLTSAKSGSGRYPRWRPRHVEIIPDKIGVAVENSHSGPQRALRIPVHEFARVGDSGVFGPPKVKMTSRCDGTGSATANRRRPCRRGKKLPQAKARQRRQ